MSRKGIKNMFINDRYRAQYIRHGDVYSVTITAKNQADAEEQAKKEEDTERKLLSVLWMPCV
jgi:hypothetical protein